MEAKLSSLNSEIEFLKVWKLEVEEEEEEEDEEADEEALKEQLKQEIKKKRKIMRTAGQTLSKAMQSRNKMEEQLGNSYFCFLSFLFISSKHMLYSECSTNGQVRAGGR